MQGAGSSAWWEVPKDKAFRDTSSLSASWFRKSVFLHHWGRPEPCGWVVCLRQELIHTCLGESQGSEAAAASTPHINFFFRKERSTSH